HLHASPVLDGLVKEIESQGKGIVIMDVDETILDTHSRKYQAYLASVKLHCGHFEELEKKSSDCEKLIGLSKIDFYKMSNGYSSYELLARLGISWSELAQKITVSMIDFYLSGRWLEEDSPISGANTFVRRLKRAGATVYFVTSRFEDTQKESSLMRLKELGFLQTGEEDKIIFRKQNEESQAFKARALEV